MKIGIITITEGENLGNRLQNYALQKYIEKNKNISVETLKNYKSNEIFKYEIDKKKNKLKKYIKFFLKKGNYNEIKRSKNFKKFDKKYIKFSKYKVSNVSINRNINEKYDSFICGSDQIWNSNYEENSNVNFLRFANSSKRIAFAPSFGTDNVNEERRKEYEKWIKDIPKLSVREDKGKKIIEELTGRTDVEVLVDPTMLLTADEWDKVSKKPKQLHTDKYILNYFLGELSEERKNQINKIAKENNCEVINILDTNSPFYQTGPSEFLYLEKHAFLICTDSFHSCVFAILYNRPFIVFDRQDSNESMSSRLDTLLKKFDLEDRRYTGVITNNDLECNYCQVYEILEKEKKKANNFLNNALDNK